MTDVYGHYFYETPPTISSGHGTKLISSDGRQFLDVYNNTACVGHAHPAVTAAIADQSARHNLNSRFVDEKIVTYSERLVDLFPSGLDTAIFTCTGSEANDLAIRFAQQVTGAKGMILFQDPYHGNTALLQEMMRKGSEISAHVPMPMSEEDLVALEEACARLKTSGVGVAGLLVDPLFVSNGVFVAPPGLLQRACQIVRAAGGLIIGDEVQAGFHRTGRCMWGFETHVFRPDIVTLGKPMGNGYPIGGLVVASELLDRIRSGPRYFNTFAANPVAAAAGLAVLDAIETEGLGQHVADMETYIGEKLTQLGLPGAGLGLGWSMPVGDTEKAGALVKALLEHWILAGTAGPRKDRLRIRPPLVFDRNDADRFFDELKPLWHGHDIAV